MKHERALALVLVVIAGCSRDARPAETSLPRGGHCDATATLVSAEPALLDVDMHCVGHGFTGFRPSEDESVPHTRDVRDERGRALRLKNGSYRLAEPSDDARVHYRVDLEAIAGEAQSFDIAERSGQSLVSAVSTWLFAPEPLSSRVAVELSVHTPKDERFVTGLRKNGDRYELGAHEIPVATYSVFGHFQRRTLSVDGSVRHGTGRSDIELAIADGPLDVERDVLARWVQDSARAVAEFWHGFPVPHTLVTLIPVPGKSTVLFGKVLPESAPGVVVLVGEHASRDRLYDDWILVHELFHLGVPSFDGEGKWFDEGLATYFEPIIRARAGYLGEQDVWKQFVRAMPFGLAAIDHKALEQAEDFGEIYWGGAIVILLADLEVRRATHGRLGLEDGLRGVLDAGGQASEVWPLSRALEVSDASTGVAALVPLAAAHANRVTPVDLDALWRKLGVVEQAGQVTLLDDAPLAGVRHSIVFGAEPGHVVAK